MSPDNQTRPRVLVFGAGAIGAFLGGRLAQAGLEVVLGARGPHLKALQINRGVLLEWADGRQEHLAIRAASPTELPDQAFDLILVTLKSTQLIAAARDIQRLLAPGGCLVMVQNGLPWWLFERMDSPRAGTPLASLQSSELNRIFDLDTILGAVIYRPATLLAPGKIFLPSVKGPQKLVLGELDGSLSNRLHQAAAVLEHGYPVQLTADIRAEKWRKLVVNLVWGPLAALTQSSSGHLVQLAATRELVASLLGEVYEVARQAGTELQIDPNEELQRVIGNFDQQPSMLQDTRAGRPLEWQAIIGACIEMAKLMQVPVPHLQTMGALIEGLDASIQRGPSAIRPVACD
jgi:2-dehydropantoate 2-reductase